MSDFAGGLLEGLTEPQTAAVRHVDGPLLVLAGPGSGKTTVVTRRVAWLVNQGIPPWQILALTFTNKAAGEMRERIEARLPENLPGRRGLTVATFHSFCVRILRRYADEARIESRFSVYDAADQREAIKKALVAADMNTRNWTPASVASAISNAKNRLQDAAAFAASAGDFYERSIAKVYRQYEKILNANHAVDFDDLLLRTAALLRGSEIARRELQDRYQFVMIDEYQDTNHAQFVIAHTLAAGHRNICVVGDPDQAIYGWRGADIRNIMEFEEHYPEAAIVPLGRNFRSTAHIVDAAAGLIAHNRRRKPKELSTELGAGERPRIILCPDEHHEAREIVEVLVRLHRDEEVPWKEMAVLYRINALSRVLEEAFRDGGVPYVIARGTEFYARKEVKDALAYLRLVMNPDDEVSLVRIVNDPPRGIGRTTLDRLEVHAMNHQMRLLETIRRAGEVASLSKRAVTSAGKFAAMVDGWRELVGRPVTAATERGPLAELVERVVRDSGLEAHFRKSGTEEDEQRLANLGELISAASEFVMPDVDGEPDGGAAAAPLTTMDLLAAWLESVALVSDSDRVDPANGCVTLMTLHTAKGLEFDVVAMAGLEEGLLPHARSASDEDQREEERRLCFVGMTRARRHLLMTRASVRTIRGMRERTIPSQFLGELPPDAVDVRENEIEYFDEGPSWLDDDHGATGGYTVGCLVRHPTFGLGRIEALTPRPAGSAARVAFQAGGVRTLILEYAKLERVEGM
jgi:DNA helicase-2/ATP-dependent DNA helicase PcrA